ncbi:MAG TPA: low affinity iron permease family protein [Polyangia bacterium]|nr:low affinity iron permease family protein [Polyangia bacterium]
MFSIKFPRTMRQRTQFGRLLERGSYRVTLWTGSAGAFALAVLVVLAWLVTGPLFHYSDTWQLVINTGTTVVTFLMVFLIQRSQNKDSLAIQLKLNELVAAIQGASNHLIDVEDLTEAELRVLHQHYRKLAVMARKDADLLASHSVEEAAQRHRRKLARDPQEPPPAAQPAPSPPATR